ncbi:MAG TPA: hypothetical protein VH325_14510 [Bryobacteraceae bacterium]|jgi:hypothetical protein|nr:hypothetical protein [Bryobacteraceae bacterium]
MRYALIAMVCAMSAFGQDRISAKNGVNGFTGSVHYAAPAFGIYQVIGAPYSAEEESEHTQTLADGTNISTTSAPTKVYRDSLGRTRTDRPLYGGMPAGHVSDAPVMVEISDPVAQVKYTLDPLNKVAHRQKLPSRSEIASRSSGRVVAFSPGGPAPMATAGGAVGGVLSQVARPAPAQDPNRLQTTTENLGPETIEGVVATGTRQTMTWPTGSQGNDRPFSTVNETWMSTELKVIVLTKSTDPRRGESALRLTNISREEPPADLFQPPSDYTLVDEEGDFEIKWGPQQ